MAGLLYLVVAVVATVGLVYLPRGLIVSGDASATAARIVASELLFRIRIASELVSTTLMLFLVLAIYRLFKGVHEAQARLMVALVAVGVPIAYLLVLNDIAALIVFKSPDFLSVFGKPQLDALGYLFLRIHTQGGPLATIFWGLWLFPFGVLVIRSGFIPRVFGFLLILNSVAYVVNSATLLLVPQYGSIVSRIVIVPELVGELSIIAWLLIRGARARPTAAPKGATVGTALTT
jgi:hypothetical protein